MLILAFLRSFASFFFKFLFRFTFITSGRWKEPISMELVEWYSNRFGIRLKTIDDIYDYGNSYMAKLLEVNVIKWRDLHESAVWKLGIFPTITENELNNKNLSENEKNNFKIFLERIKEKIECHNGNEPITKISKDIIARGIGLCAGYTGKRAVFYVYSCSNNLELIKISMMGTVEVEIESKIKNDRLMVSYIPPKKGTYLLFVSKNGWMAPGSPFEVCIEDPPPDYKGNFGASEWYENIAEEKINSIPEIQVRPSTPEFSVWSSMTEFGSPYCRRRSVTYIAPDGATFPISIASSEDSIDGFDDLWFADSEIKTPENDIEPDCELTSSSIDNSKPYLEKNSMSSDETVSEKIIEVIITRKRNSSPPDDQNLKKSKSIRAGAEPLVPLHNEVKTDTKRSKSAKSIPNRKKIFVKIEQYKKKEEIKVCQVKQLKHFWNNVIDKKEKIPTEIKNVDTIKINKKNEFVSDSNLNIEKERKKRFEMARSLFSALEKRKEFEKVKDIKESNSILKSFKRDLKNIFIDFEHGIGLPGVPNRLALLETLKSVDKRPSFPNYDPQYPHLPTTPLQKFKSRSNKDLIPWNKILYVY